MSHSYFLYDTGRFFEVDSPHGTSTNHGYCLAAFGAILCDQQEEVTFDVTVWKITASWFGRLCFVQCGGDGIISSRIRLNVAIVAYEVRELDHPKIMGSINLVIGVQLKFKRESLCLFIILKNGMHQRSMSWSVLLISELRPSFNRTRFRLLWILRISFLRGLRIFFRIRSRIWMAYLWGTLFSGGDQA